MDGAILCGAAFGNLRAGDGASNDCLLSSPIGQGNVTVAKTLMSELVQPLPKPLPYLEESGVSSVEPSDAVAINAAVAAKLVLCPPRFGVSNVSSCTLDAANPAHPPPVAGPRGPLRFSFSGVSIWLYLSQSSHDLDRALSAAASQQGVLPIPSPHVTVLYGVTHLDEEEARERFNSQLREKVRGWPSLKVKGLLADVSWDGVDGEVMDMAWIELTLDTSNEHEELVDAVHEVFRASRAEDHGSGNLSLPLRVRPWTPHLSLAYDNPEDSVLNLDVAVQLASQFPTLLTTEERNVTAISLWRTDGAMEEWMELERIEFGEVEDR